jgi:hypothetical protein
VAAALGACRVRPWPDPPPKGQPMLLRTRRPTHHPQSCLRRLFRRLPRRRPEYRQSPRFLPLPQSRTLVRGRPRPRSTRTSCPCDHRHQMRRLQGPSPRPQRPSCGVALGATCRCHRNWTTTAQGNHLRHRWPHRRQAGSRRGVRPRRCP